MKTETLWKNDLFVEKKRIGKLPDGFFFRGKIVTIDCDLAITEVKYGVDQNNRRYSEQHTNTANMLSKF